MRGGDGGRGEKRSARYGLHIFSYKKTTQKNKQYRPRVGTTLASCPGSEECLLSTLLEPGHEASIAYVLGNQYTGLDVKSSLHSGVGAHA